MTNEQYKKPDSRQPFRGLLTESLDLNQLLDLRVNRDDELSRCLETVCNRRNNLLVYGERGIGKTFLMRLFHQRVETQRKDTIACYLNLMGLGFYGHDEVALAAFPNEVLIKLCTTLWCKVLSRDYSELRMSASDSPTAITLRTSAEKTITRIYAELVTVARRFHYARESSLGASAVLKGEMKESVAQEWQAIDMLPNDFFHFLDEIFDAVLKPNQIDQVVLICDEVNLRPVPEQQELLVRYLELFGAKNVRFTLVVQPEAAKKVRPILTAFEELELGGLPHQTEIQTLLEKHLRDADVSISPEAIPVVWEVFRGHPLYTLQVARQAYDDARRTETQLIDAAQMAIACARTLRYLRKMDREMGGL